MNFNVDELDAILQEKYSNKWGNVLIRGKHYDIPAIPVGSKIPLMKWATGKHRMLFNQCPKCNSSAPAIDKCSVCEGDRVVLYTSDKEHKKELRLLIWNRYVYEIINKK